MGPSTEHGIDFHLFLDVLEKEKVIEQTAQKSYRVKQECKDSISKFILNNYPDNVVNVVISRVMTIVFLLPNRS